MQTGGVECIHEENQNEKEEEKEENNNTQHIKSGGGNSTKEKEYRGNGGEFGQNSCPCKIFKK